VKKVSDIRSYWNLGPTERSTVTNKEEEEERKRDYLFGEKRERERGEREGVV